jgi:hypothetical protein
MIETLGQIPRYPSIQCWGCGGDHMHKNFPYRGEKGKIIHNVKQADIVEDMVINVPRIYTALDNKKAKFQSHMIEMEGKINNQTIVILIDSRDSHSYLDPNMVEIFHFPRSKLGKSWLVQLDTKDKIKINEMVKACPMNMNGLSTREDLKIIPLGSYDCVIGMDWLDQHHVVLDYYNKEFTFLWMRKGT